MRHFCVLLTLLALVCPAFGQSPPSDSLPPVRMLPTYRPGAALSLRVGTAGFGADIAKSLGRRLSLRLGANLFDYRNKIEQGSPLDQLRLAIEYTVRLNSFNLLVDYYPFPRMGFRLSAGAFYNLNQLVVFGKPTHNVTLNDIVFTIEEIGSFDGKVDFQRLAPYAGIGWGHPFLRSRLKFMLDAGIFYQQSPMVTLTSSGMLAPTAEQSLIIEQNLRPVKYYPVLNIGLSFNFSSAPR